MISVNLSRRIMLLAPSLILALPHSARGQGGSITPLTPRARYINETSNATCSLAQALSILAQNGDYQALLEAARQSFLDAAGAAFNALNEGGEELGNVVPISDERLDALDRFAPDGLTNDLREYRTFKEYYEFVGQAADLCASTLRRIIEAPADVTDTDIINLFGTMSAIQLLNATVVGFGLPPSDG